MLKQITNKEQWDNKIGSQKQSQFLQSWSWGEFQISLGRKVWHLDLSGVFVLAIKMPLIKNKFYLYVPRINHEIDEDKLKILKKLANAENCIFIRIEPIKQDIISLGFKKVAPMQPKKTLLLDLTKSEEALLKDMHSKTRYNIRLASKKGVEVGNDIEEKFPIFYDLMLNTYERKGKKLFSRNYYLKLEHNKITDIVLAKFESEILCGNLISMYGDTVTYIHGGSSDEHKNLMAPHLLQWETIKKAKNLGFKYYDFWGIEERYPGVARFKRGFSGQEIEYSGTFDLAIDKLWYAAYQVVKKFK
jgi:lipid II:glycine glycyltransferase (peptidoglycan interpeptide bridge formation enzyme)